MPRRPQTSADSYSWSRAAPAGVCRCAAPLDAAPSVRPRPRSSRPSLGLRLVFALSLAWAACGDGPTFGDGSPTPPPDITVGDGNEPDEPDETPPSAIDPTLRLDSIEPTEGPVTGFLDVLIRGNGFTPGLEVAFGDSPALDVFVINTSTAIVTLPPQPSGRVDVSIFHPEIDYGAPRILPSAFRYVADLFVSFVQPAESRTSGGIGVTVSGGGFSPGTTLFFDGRPALLQERIDDQSITGIVPPGAPGPARVQVVGPNGTAEASGLFTYRENPSISSLTPVRGPAAGGTAARLVGRGLTGDSLVRIGDKPASVIASDSVGRWLDVILPAGSAGTLVDVVASNAFGTSSLNDAYSYDATDVDPFILSCSHAVPSSGAAAGGTALTIGCNGLEYGAEVLLGDESLVDVFVDADNGVIHGVSPPGSGDVDITVASPFAEVTLAAPFRYDAAPELVVTAVEPQAGPVGGGTELVLTGTGFVDGASVMVGALPASAVDVVSATEIRATSPPGAPGRVDVSVRVGPAVATLAGAFDYASDGLSLALVSPAVIASPGGTYVRVFGTGFGPETEVRIGGIACDVIERVSPAELHVRSPQLEVDVHDASVSSDGKTVRLEDAVTVYNPRGARGGVWGGPIDESLHVTVRGYSGYGAVPGAFVLLERDGGSSMTGLTNDNGQVTLSEPDLVGPVTVTASKAGFTAHSVVHFDGRNVTIFLRQNPVPPPPADGGGGGDPLEPPPNGVIRGRVLGLGKYVIAPPGSCEAVAITDTDHCAPCDISSGCETEGFACVPLEFQGSRCLSLCETDTDCPSGYGCTGSLNGTRCVPYPGDKAAYCAISSTSIFSSNVQIQETGWVDADGYFELDSERLGELAVYCVGGYLDSQGTFTSTVLGVARHIFVHAGEELNDLEIDLEFPLQRTFRLRLMDPPTWPSGLAEPPNIIVSLDLGPDGVIPFSRSYIDGGDHQWLAPHQLARLSGSLYDAEYFFYTTLLAGDGAIYPRSYNLVQYVTEVVEDRLPVREDGDWRLEGIQLERDLHGIWGSSASHVYAVGADGLVLFYNGNAWTQQPIGTTADLHAVSGRAAQDVWAVGDDATVRHFDGLAWQVIDAPADDYRAVATRAGADVFVAGQVRVRRFDGSTWSIEGPPSMQGMRALAVASDGRVAAVGDSGRAFLRVGGVWQPLPTDTASTLRAVMFDGEDILAAGDNGALLTGDTSGLVAVDLGPLLQDLSAITQTADGEVIVVGDNGIVLSRPSTLDPEWQREVIEDYRSRAHGVFAPPEGGAVRVVGSAAFILGPFMHFPVITAPDPAVPDLRFSWLATGGPQGQVSRLRLYPQSGVPLWEFIVDGDVDYVDVPDLLNIAGIAAVGVGQRRLEVTRILNADFDVDGFSSSDFSIYRRDSWSIHRSEFSLGE